MSVSLSRNAERFVLLSAILASSMAFIDSSALDVAARAMQLDLKASGSELLWIVNAYTLILSALILIGGSLGDHYGRKRIFAIGIVLFTAASLVCALAVNAPLLIAARAVQGIGGALMVPGSLALITATFDSSRRGTAIGTWSTGSTLTTLLGPPLGGWLASVAPWGWRLVFLINLPLAAIALWALIVHVPESRDEHAPRQLDWIGAVLVTLGLGGLTYGFTEGPGAGFTSPQILLALIGGAVALIAFVVVELRSDHPMVPLRLFASRTFTGTNLLTLFLYAALGGLPFFLLLNLQQVQNYPETIVGLTFLPLTILIGAMSRWAGGLIDRVGAKLPLTIGPAIAGVGFALFGLPGVTNGPQDYWLTYFPGAVVLAFGMGITVAPLTTAVMGSAPQESAGTASGINNAVARTARVLAIAIFGAIALLSFRSALETRTAPLDLSDEARSALSIEAANLGAAEVPSGLDDATTQQISEAIRWAFVDSFRLLSWISAGLAWVSALLAWLLVEDKHARKPKEKAATPMEV